MKNTARPARILFTLLLASFAAPVASVAASYTFTKILDDTGDFSSIRTPALNNSGEVAFFSYRDSGEEGIFRADGSGVTTISVTSPGGFHSFLGCQGGSVVYAAPVIDDSGHVAFCAYNFDSLTLDCWETIYVGNGVWTHAITDSGPGGSLYSDGANPAFSSNGILAFRGRDAGTGTRGFYVVEDGLTELVVDTVGELENPREVDVNDSGQIAFMALRDDGEFAIYRARAGGLMEMISNTTLFMDLDWDPAIANGGTVAFEATDDSWLCGIYTWDGSLSLVAQIEYAFDMFQGPAINANDEVAFWWMLEDWTSGIFTGPDPIEDRVIGGGDSLFGDLVSSVEIGMNAINDSGQIAFLYQIYNGESGIALATPGDLSAVPASPPEGRDNALLLGPAVPNPASSLVGFSFRLPESAADPRLAIYDVSGRLVRELESPSGQGERRVEWDGRDGGGRDVPPGVYFAKLTAGREARTARVLVVR